MLLLLLFVQYLMPGREQMENVNSIKSLVDEKYTFTEKLFYRYSKSSLNMDRFLETDFKQNDV